MLSGGALWALLLLYRPSFAKLRASLGRTTLLTDDEGNPIAGGSPRYYAYGNERIPNSLIALPTEYSFTGQRYANGTGLIYMNVRYYDPNWARLSVPIRSCRIRRICSTIIATFMPGGIRSSIMTPVGIARSVSSQF